MKKIRLSLCLSVAGSKVKKTFLIENTKNSTFASSDGPLVLREWLRMRGGGGGMKHFINDLGNFGGLVFS